MTATEWTSERLSYLERRLTEVEAEFSRTGDRRLQRTARILRARIAALRAA